MEETYLDGPAAMFCTTVITSKASVTILLLMDAVANILDNKLMEKGAWAANRSCTAVRECSSNAKATQPSQKKRCFPNKMVKNK